jgi:hypothetical protein
VAYDNDYITANLHRHYAVCLTRRRQREAAEQWQDVDGLAGRSVSELAAVVADSHHRDHNQVAGALLAAHRNGQAADTAMVLLLSAARPLVLVLDPADRFHDSRASLWSAVATRLSCLDPDAVATSAVPFLVNLLGRIRPYARRHPSEPAGPIAASDAELELLLTRAHDPAHDVPAVAIARLDLAIARQDHGWTDLTRYAALGRNRSGVYPSRIARHRRRLAHHLGHVA